MSRIVVCDTGPLLHLSEAKIIDLLRLAGEIFIPNSVAEEIKRNAGDFGLPNWVTVKELEDHIGERRSNGEN
jgi:predicted nucleic acid-binding protein